MTEEDRKLFFSIVSILKKLPALSKIRVRFGKIDDLGRVRYYPKTGNFNIVISKKYSNDLDICIYILAHECAHVIADMNGTHGPLFSITEDYVINLIFFVLGCISRHPDERDFRKMCFENCSFHKQRLDKS